MKYHYQTGVQKTLGERCCKSIWLAIGVFAALMIWDMLFNYSRIFIDLLVWTAR
jgi:hypothetical protein